MPVIPRREADLARPRARKGKDQRPVTKGVARPVRVPRADPAWHPIAKKLYDSLKTSGQADFYQNSDWAVAWSICEDLSFYKRMERRSGQMLQSIYGALSDLLVTEADRRRLRIELEAPKPEGPSASVTAINDYRKELGLT
jgi:hypothetical protein